jgi:hypothetical protein
MNNLTPFFFDGGRSLRKYGKLKGNIKTSMSGVAQITETEYNRVVKRKKTASTEYFAIYDPKERQHYYFCVGEQAQRHTMMAVDNNADRFVWNNIGVTCIASILDTFGFKNIDLHVWTSFPPVDLDFIELLQDAIMGIWYVKSYDKEVVINIQEVDVEDEPVCILRYQQLTAEGNWYQNAPIKGRTLVIDGGGGTLDIAEVDELGMLVENAFDSAPIGINDYIDRFHAELKTNYPELFKSVTRLRTQILRESFQTGILKISGRELEVTPILEPIAHEYVNASYGWVNNKTQGVANYETLVIGGGAAGLLGEKLRLRWQHANARYASTELNSIQTIGAQGLRKIYLMYLNNGEL